MNKFRAMSILSFLPIIILTLVGCGASEDGITQSPELPEKPSLPVEIGKPIALTIVGSDSDLNNPEAASWREIQEYAVDLMMAPPVHPSVNLRYDPAAAPLKLGFRVASDGEHYYVRLRWPDETQNTINAHHKFSDGAAVQFALAGGEQTSFMMGATATPVNIWYWKAGSAAAQNLAAGGFGTTTKLEQESISAAETYLSGENKEWHLVLSRPIVSEGEYQVELSPSVSAHLSFAVWQGEDKQRDGLKRVYLNWVTVAPADTSEVN